MVKLKLETLDTVEKLCRICDSFQDVPIDVVNGRYTVDGCSVLGVAALLGNTVNVVSLDKTMAREIEKAIEKIGGVIVE